MILIDIQGNPSIIFFIQIPILSREGVLLAITYNAGISFGSISNLMGVSGVHELFGGIFPIASEDGLSEFGPS
jgi:hypothetical protein